MAPLQLTLLGVGAMRSPRYRPAGLIVEHAGDRVLLDGGNGGPVAEPLSAWLTTDERAELMPVIRRRARAFGLEVAVRQVDSGALRIVPHPVVHTSHPTWGYLIRVHGRTAAWAPEFWEFPAWAAGVDLMFAEAAGWRRPIRFAGGVGGHAAALDVAENARRMGVRRLVFAHIGRLTIRALDAGERPPFGEIGHDGQSFEL